MQQINIRPATISDFEAVYNFVCGLENEQFDKTAMRECYEANLDVLHHHYLVATASDEPIGYISCHGQILLHHCGLVYEIQEMFVNEAYRSQGVGKLLLEALLELLNKEDYKLLEVASSFKRVNAHRFYEANGFVKTTYKFKREPGR